MSTTKSITTRAHKHSLKYINAAELYAGKGMIGWICDACGQRSKELRQSHSYHCMKCDFDLCKECPKSLKSDKHRHSLVITDTNDIYEDGLWSCDNCGAEAEDEGQLSWHCEKGCDFDLCYGCTKDHSSSAHSAHKLKKVNPQKIYPNNSHWHCNICNDKWKIDDNMKPYNCKKCNFDLCKDCMIDTTVIKDDVEYVQKEIENSLTVTDGERETKDDNSNSKLMVFISYQWDIQDQVLKLKKYLEANKITCWMDTGKLVGGDDLKHEIDKGIRGCKLVLSCVTDAYTKSHACRQEVALADALKKPILPVLFESIAWPPEGPMAMPFAPLLYVGCESGLNTDNVKKVVTNVKSKI